MAGTRDQHIAPESQPLLWLGLGSNVLISDAGFSGTVIQTQGCLTRLERCPSGFIHAEAGVSSAKLARFAARHDLIGIEFLAGIPGTVGGALAMNAGAWGGEIWRQVRRVRTIDRQGRCYTRTPDEFEIGYREVKGPAGEWFLEVEFDLKSGDGKHAMARMRELLDQRARTQPIGAPSCGSVFRNPPDDHAARLIEHCGLKGRRVGGAQVSEQHANFIINTGEASAADIAALIDQIQRTVESTTGVRLQTEVKRIGEEA